MQGREAIAPVLQALVENRIGFGVELARVLVAGDVALGMGTLTMVHRDGDDDHRFEHTSSSLVVYARDSSGAWRIAIDAPWGLPGTAGA
jgi:ketosteroid isomerase-like protein